jgi:hypothetical protein
MSLVYDADVRTVYLERRIWATVFGALPAESRVVGGAFAGPNFWLKDDQGKTLVFLPAAEVAGGD